MIYIYVCVCLSGAGLERLAGKVLLNLSFKKTDLRYQATAEKIQEDLVTQKLKARLENECASIGVPGGPTPPRKPSQKANMCLVL